MLSLMQDELFVLKEPLTVVGALRNHSRLLELGQVGPSLGQCHPV